MSEETAAAIAACQTAMEPLTKLIEAQLKVPAETRGTEKERKALLDQAEKFGGAHVRVSLQNAMEVRRVEEEQGRAALVAQAMVNIASAAGVRIQVVSAHGRKARSPGAGTGTRQRSSPEELATNLAAFEKAASKIGTKGSTKMELIEASGVDGSKFNNLFKKALANKTIKHNGEVGKAGRYLAP